MKMFQVHDDNHNTYLFVAISADDAMKQAFEMLEAGGKLEHMGENLDERQAGFEEEYRAEHIPQGSRPDNDGPLCFYG